MEFTDFDVFALPELDEPAGPNTDAVQNVDPCPYDFVQVTDGDGTMLMNKSCGYMKVNESDPNFFVPPNITSNTNMVTVFFNTDGTGAKTGWSLNWRAVASGKSSIRIKIHEQMDIFLGCIIEENTDYSGNDILNNGESWRIMESQRACVDYCKTIAGAPFWKWDSGTKKCSIKSSSSGRTSVAGAVSGNRECGTG